MAVMSPDPVTVLDWSYVPHDFFEEHTELVLADGAISISGGTARGQFDGSRYAEGRAFRDRVHDELMHFFLAQQIMVATPFTLSAASLARLHSDGRRDLTMLAEPGRYLTSGAAVDSIRTNAQGTVVQDTKAERLQSQQQFRDKALQLCATDHVMRRLLQMFNNAFNDPENRFIHLYDIRDCLVKELNGGALVKTKLGISTTDWSRFGKLANYDPLTEGRHRGDHLTLRNASADEIAFATGFARKLIEQYVQYKITSRTEA